MPEITFLENLDKRVVERLAYDIIKTRYGNIPHPGEPVLKEGVWLVPIHVRYPRVIMDELGEHPKKVRFMDIRNVGDIKFDARTGVLMDKPHYNDVRGTIRAILESVATVVDKALVKVGADRFSRLPFPTHMHTPIVDILSWILVNNELDLEELFLKMPDDEKKKYLQHVGSLADVGLVRMSEGKVLPDDYLIEVERRTSNLHEGLSDALTVFFERGYDMIDSIRQVLGPHLAISGYCYQSSLEYGDLIAFSYPMIEKSMMKRYSGEKRIKIPRYIAQLEAVDLLKEDTVKGETVWLGDEEVFLRVQAQADILEPFSEYLSLPASR